MLWDILLHMKAEQNSNWETLLLTLANPLRSHSRMWWSGLTLPQQQTWDEDLDARSWFGRRFREALMGEQRGQPGKGRKPAKGVVWGSMWVGQSWIPWDVGATGEHPPSLIGWVLLPAFFFFFWHFRPTVGIKTLGPEKSLRQENAHGGCGFPARVRWGGQGWPWQWSLLGLPSQGRDVSIMFIHLIHGHLTGPHTSLWSGWRLTLPKPYRDLLRRSLCERLTEDRQFIIHQQLSSANNGLLGNLRPNVTEMKYILKIHMGMRNM